MENRVKNHLLFWASNCIVMLNYSASNELFCCKVILLRSFSPPDPVGLLYEILLLYLGEQNYWIERKCNYISLGMVGKSPFWHSWLGLNLNFEYKWGPVEYLMTQRCYFPHHFQKATSSFHNFHPPLSVLWWIKFERNSFNPFFLIEKWCIQIYFNFHELSIQQMKKKVGRGEVKAFRKHSYVWCQSSDCKTRVVISYSSKLNVSQYSRKSGWWDSFWILSNTVNT